jgi:hypothetical protein
MKMLNVTNLDRKFGIRGPKTTGAKPPSKVCLLLFAA